MREDDCPQEPHRMTSFDQMQQSVSRIDMVLLGNCPAHPLLSCWTSLNPLELLGFLTCPYYTVWAHVRFDKTRLDSLKRELLFSQIYSNF